jgi:hypothetical protein
MYAQLQSSRVTMNNPVTTTGNRERTDSAAKYMLRAEGIFLPTNTFA